MWSDAKQVDVMGRLTQKQTGEHNTSIKVAVLMNWKRKGSLHCRCTRYTTVQKASCLILFLQFDLGCSRWGRSHPLHHGPLSSSIHARLWCGFAFPSSLVISSTSLPPVACNPVHVVMCLEMQVLLKKITLLYVCIVNLHKWPCPIGLIVFLPLSPSSVCLKIGLYSCLCLEPKAKDNSIVHTSCLLIYFPGNECIDCLNLLSPTNNMWRTLSFLSLVHVWLSLGLILRWVGYRVPGLLILDFASATSSFLRITTPDHIPTSSG